jgi:hypothetical protein
VSIDKVESSNPNHKAAGEHKETQAPANDLHRLFCFAFF